MEEQQEAERQVWLVAYTDDEGPHACAFSTRALADAFIDWMDIDATPIDTGVDAHTMPPDSERDPEADRGDWEFHQSHDQ